MRHWIDVPIGKITTWLFLFIIALAAGSGVLRAQVPHDTKGTRFWVTFMKNDGNSSVSDLRLYLAGDVPTKAYIIYHLMHDTVIVPLPVPRTTVEVNINTLFGNGVELGVGEEFSNKGIEILADDDITVYGININSRSADAFLGLPDDVLTGRYIVLAYQNGFSIQTGQFDEPSEFAVVGTEDGTTVKITSPAGTRVNGRPNSTFTVGLDRGEVFFGQASTNQNGDVSGTEVSSNKPVAVFGGHSRTSIPDSVGNFRDHLVEQMPPLEAWGKEAVLTPFYTITPSSPFKAQARVLAAFDNTNWSIDGVAQVKLMRGKPVFVPLKPCVITADQPILVAEYDHSVGVSWDQQDQFPKLGDPLMMLIPPSEQFDTAYAFQCVLHPEFDDTAHFCNVVIPTTSTSTVKVDGATGTWPFFPVPGSRFSYAQIRVSPGAHTINAGAPFGLYVYGYGPANSYGYNGGMLFRTLVNDFQPPEVSAADFCDSLAGVATDSHITDTGVDSLFVTQDTRNAVVTIDPFKAPKDTVHFSARLIDPFNDGIAGVKAIDSGGRSITRVMGIPGFTLQVVGSKNGAVVSMDTLISFNQKQFCREISIQNYGGYPHVIDGISVLPDTIPGLTISTQLPLTIGPGETKTIEVCYDGVDDSVIERSIAIHAGCMDRTVASMPFVGVIDTNAPELVKPPTACLDDYVVTLIDQSKFGFGVATVDEVVNGDLLPSTTSTEIHIHWRDRHRDLIYQIRVSDRAGNSFVERDTLPGFTVAAVDPVGDTLSVSTGFAWLGDSLEVNATRCDSVILTNFGSHPITIANAVLAGNWSISIPPAQLPITIAPGEWKKLEVCLARPGGGALKDTLFLSDECGTIERVPLQVPTNSFDAYALDNCHSMLQVTFSGASKRTFLMTPAPNPTSGASASVDIGLTQPDLISMAMYDANGNHALDILSGAQLQQGITRVTFDVSSLKSGAYFCRMTTAHGEHLVEKVVISR